MNMAPYLPKLLLPCDIVLARHRGAFLSSAIRMFEGWQNPTNNAIIASHSGLITRPGIELEAEITEALTKVREHTLAEAGYGSDPKIDICVFRPINITDAQKHRIVASALSFVGDTYGYAKILAQLGDSLIGGGYFFRRLCRIDKFPICSYVVGKAFADEGLDFGVSYHAVTPDDIWTFILANIGTKYQFVWQFGDMYAD
jgi:hypothetical protein